jgi:amino acid permease
MAPQTTSKLSMMKHRERAGSWHITSMLQDTWRPENAHQTMSSLAFIVNIVADLVPSGFLSISYGMSGAGYIPSLILLLIIGFIATFTMWTCGRTCEITGKYEFASQWIATIGPRTAWVPLAVIIVTSFGALLCYACYVADIMDEVMPAFGAPIPRDVCLIAVSIFPTLPLAFMKDMSAMAYTSSVAFVAMLYMCLVMLVRAFDGSYSLGGQFYHHSHHQGVHPGRNAFRMEPTAMILLNILAMAFHCHCNACKYYRELDRAAPGHFGKCTSVAMFICGLLYALMGGAGFHTFGWAAEGTILENYDLSDWPVNVGRVLMCLSLLSSYAIMFGALRESAVSLTRFVAKREDLLERIWTQDLLSTFLVTLITIIAALVHNSGMVDSFVGAVGGNAIIFVIPCALYVGAMRAHFDKGRNKWQLRFNYFLICLGVLFCAMGFTCIFMYEMNEDEEERGLQAVGNETAATNATVATGIRELGRQFLRQLTNTSGATPETQYVGSRLWKA